jgi:hypothetical protein
MNTKFDIAQEINTLANEHYGDSAMALAFAWGSARALLTDEQLEIILTLAKDLENNK